MAEKDDNQEKKIIVDEDWKDQAHKEKDKLASEQEKQQTEQENAPLPQADFAALVSMLITQTFFALGFVGQSDQEEKPEPDLKLAKYLIDMLSTLEEKTKGNLADDEQKMLTDALYQLRISYVKLAEGE